MQNSIERQLSRLLAFVRYLSWAELLKLQFHDEMEEISPDDREASEDHEWRLFGLMSYWYSSLFVVVEGWGELELSDPLVCALLDHPDDFRTLLRRYRNAVFHYQPSLVDSRFVGLLAQGAKHVYWIEALQHEITRSCAEALDSLMATDDQRSELQDEIRSVLHWYPSRYPPEVDSLARTLRSAIGQLSAYPGDSSNHRRALEEEVKEAEAILAKGRRDWVDYRQDLCRKLGIK